MIHDEGRGQRADCRRQNLRPRKAQRRPLPQRTQRNTGGTGPLGCLGRRLMKSSLCVFGQSSAGGNGMACKPEVLRQVPLFALLDDDETAVLAAQVELKAFAARQRIWKIGDSGGQAYVMVSGAVRVTTVDEDHQ